MEKETPGKVPWREHAIFGFDSAMICKDQELLPAVADAVELVYDKVFDAFIKCVDKEGVASKNLSIKPYDEEDEELLKRIVEGEEVKTLWVIVTASRESALRELTVELLGGLSKKLYKKYTVEDADPMITLNAGLRLKGDQVTLDSYNLNFCIVMGGAKIFAILEEDSPQYASLKTVLTNVKEELVKREKEKAA